MNQGILARRRRKKRRRNRKKGRKRRRPRRKRRTRRRGYGMASSHATLDLSTTHRILSKDERRGIGGGHC